MKTWHWVALGVGAYLVYKAKVQVTAITSAFAPLPVGQRVQILSTGEVATVVTAPQDAPGSLGESGNATYTVGVTSATGAVSAFAEPRSNLKVY